MKIKSIQAMYNDEIVVSEGDIELIKRLCFYTGFVEALRTLMGPGSPENTEEMDTLMELLQAELSEFNEDSDDPYNRKACTMALLEHEDTRSEDAMRFMFKKMGIDLPEDRVMNSHPTDF